MKRKIIEVNAQDITLDMGYDQFIIGGQNELDIKDITINTYLRALKTILLFIGLKAGMYLVFNPINMIK